MTKAETNFLVKLRSSGLRPTKQRIKICEVLFNRDKTFHFSINDLIKILKDNHNEKMSLATVYNTLHSFSESGLLNKVIVDGSRCYFDTRLDNHSHFFWRKQEN